MNKLFKIKLGWLFLLFILLDILCTGAGMGVPIFCITLGFLTGWGIMKIILLRTNDLNEIFRKSIKYGLATTLVTFVLMLIVWGIAITVFFNNGNDFKNFGNPLILFDPKLSFFGWLTLMIVISPLLQLLTTVFSFYISLFIIKKKNNTA